jgi:hypothetical protein
MNFDVKILVRIVVDLDACARTHWFPCSFVREAPLVHDKMVGLVPELVLVLRLGLRLGLVVMV